MKQPDQLSYKIIETNIVEFIIPNDIFLTENDRHHHYVKAKKVEALKDIALIWVLLIGLMITALTQ